MSLSNGIVTLGFEKRPYNNRQYSCAEIQTTARFGYGVYEARMKTDEGSGINAAFFSYTNSPHDEIDFEVLAKDTSKVSLNTYVSGKPNHGTTVDVPGGTTQFNHYAFVWEEGRLRWYVNGKLVHEATGSDLPTHPQKLMLSHWGSDTFTEWMGPFEDPGRKLIMEVDWVAYTAPGESCQFPESVACALN
ncbi:family 16 glycosylhydrolase [Chelativorans sp. AA-79]|uniref:family 16 glycosylhydrolase n=1 Tax=Chelativorans sp. AA-79 TaxID=3028735 RepID=UPI003211DEA9